MEAREKPLKDLLHDLSEDSVRLLRQETALFKSEMKLRIDKIERDVGVLGVGGAVAYAGVLVLCAAVVLLLGEVMPMWLAATIVGAACAVAGAVLVAKGKEKLAGESVVPRTTIESVKQDLRTMREATT